MNISLWTLTTIYSPPLPLLYYTYLTPFLLLLSLLPSPHLALILPLLINLNHCVLILSVPVLQKEAKAIKFDVTRTDFEQGCSVLFDRALAPVSRLLGELGKTALLFFSIVLLESSTGSLNFAFFNFIDLHPCVDRLNFILIDHIINLHAFALFTASSQRCPKKTSTRSC